MKVNLDIRRGDIVSVGSLHSCRRIQKTVERVDDVEDRVWFTDGSTYHHADQPEMTIEKQRKNALDLAYEALRRGWDHLPRNERKQRESEMYQKIRELRTDRMTPTTLPLCGNGSCGAVVSDWGMWCAKCLKELRDER